MDGPKDSDFVIVGGKEEKGVGIWVRKWVRITK